MNNNVIIETLRKKALTFYPYQIPDSDPTFLTSTEFQHLLKTKDERIGLMMPHWKEFIKDLEKESGKYGLMIEDWKATLSIDHCFKAVVIAAKSASRREDCLRFVINVSVLIPFYVIHQAVVTPDSRVVSRNKFDAVSFRVPGEYNNLYEFITNTLEGDFIDYRAIGQEVVLTEINEIEYDRLGRISGHSEQNQPMNLFNVFFSNHYL